MSTSVTALPTIKPVTVLSNMDSVVGGAFSSKTNHLYFVEFDGDIHRLDLSTGSDTAIGAGYNSAEDIALSRDGRYAYVTEFTGNLLKIELPDPNVFQNTAFNPNSTIVTAGMSRPRTTTIAAGMNAPRQIALDEDHNQAYVVESVAPGRLLRVDLKTGSLTPVVSGLKSTGGVVVTRDGKYAYVTDHRAPGAAQITRIGLADNSRKIFPFLGEPFFLTFLGAAEDQLLVTTRNPENQIRLIDLVNSATPEARTIADAPTPTKPSSQEPLVGPQKAVVIAPDKVLICSDWGISKLSLSPYTIEDNNSTANVLLGFGWVPVDCIAEGYADTTQHPKAAQVFKVVAAPFGGYISVMINHAQAAAINHAQAPAIEAGFYSIEVDGKLQATPFADIRRLPPKFEPEVVWTSPTANSLFPVRTPLQQQSFEHEGLIGGLIDTTTLSDGPRNIVVRLYTADDPKMEVPSTKYVPNSIQILVDNTSPMASIDEILLNGTPVAACGFANIGKPILKPGQPLAGPTNDNFQFVITAEQFGKHLAGWSLGAIWGDNKSGPVASESWPAPPQNDPLMKEWLGLEKGTVPSLPGHWHAFSPTDPSSANCAHTFVLTVWDRVINGWGSAHSPAEYTKSITILP
ncbi:MAG TPA: hypothetical protein VNW97_19235 [Candidatus Saccharimonadales bacterium]|jgi:hypothetical protein|nr:hypothetical protein [Candidatus Saccharimonadales bacterium]